MNPSTTRLVLEVILEKTKDKKTTTIEDIKKEFIITDKAYNETIDYIKSENIVTFSSGDISANINQRLAMAINAIQLGGDFERISNSLGWLEFEEFVAHVFEENGYNVLRRYRFQAEGRRWEIDVLATQYPYIVCAECKHWTSGMGNSAARNIIETHIEKTDIMSRHIEEISKKINVHRWRDAIIIPMALTLSPTQMRIYRRVPAVSIHSLPSFLNEFHGQLERLIHYRVNLPPYKPKPKQMKIRG